MTRFDALLSRLKTSKPGETYPLDPYERKLILDEIERLRTVLRETARRLIIKGDGYGDEAMAALEPKP